MLNTKVAIKRGGEWQSFTIPYVEHRSVMQALKYIQKNIDPTLAFYCSCRIGKCGGCVMVINGDKALACAVEAKESFSAEPNPSGRLIRDLYVIPEENYNERY